MGTPRHVFNKNKSLALELSPWTPWCFASLRSSTSLLESPDKLMPVFKTLMFPWPASYRSIRVNAVIAVGAYLLVVGKVVATGV
jgi:hypothetical protein